MCFFEFTMQLYRYMRADDEQLDGWFYQCYFSTKELHKVECMPPSKWWKEKYDMVLPDTIKKTRFIPGTFIMGYTSSKKK